MHAILAVFVTVAIIELCLYTAWRAQRNAERPISGHDDHNGE